MKWNPDRERSLSRFAFTAHHEHLQRARDYLDRARVARQNNDVITFRMYDTMANFEMDESVKQKREGLKHWFSQFFSFN